MKGKRERETHTQTKNSAFLHIKYANKYVAFDHTR